ncbi:hypothetical protein LTR78_009548 [Recurvomyces mirabilis]|uniref:Protein kinase domain-containing protein n=1 Tax=Recurvomyces mirabilis TaxID=574656 RepID=A0AAE0TP94_9PEZI|nr:hypothetical protein LTR78_009548 [Recurvomyces mirabilis]KAK5149997.1 hypothetical protein LTS14_010469 [Recurvomyces mirabilis]
MAAVAHPTRPHIRRNSPLAIHRDGGMLKEVPTRRGFKMEDSDSDDEPPPAIKFSKVTQALLANAPVPSSPLRQGQHNEAPRFDRSVSANKAGLDTPSRAPGLKIVRKSSPSVLGHDRGQTPPRIVQVGKPGSGARSISISGPYPQRYAMKHEPTPEEQNRYASDHARNTSMQHAPETVTRYGPGTIGRSRNPSADPPVPPGSQRVKRAPLGTGTFLGGKARRFKRRDSEDNVSPVDDVHNGSASQPSTAGYTPHDRSTSGTDGVQSRNDSVNTRATSVEPVSAHDFASRNDGGRELRHANANLSRSQMSDGSRPPSRQTSREQLRSRQPSVEPYQRRRPSIPAADAVPAASDHQSRQPGSDVLAARPAQEQKPPQRVPSLSRAQYRYAAPKVHTDASEDQENMPPPTFKRNKDQDFKVFGQRPINILSDDEKPKPRMVEETPVLVQQQERKALGAISGNTPHRPAPAPPPKMSVLETATTTAGASVTKSKKKRSHIVVNGKIFTQMGKIGKGGSSDVFCVMAENYKTFALKRVKLDDCDESAVRGYKGEIDLLKSLSEVERVVRLFDWELNDEKQELLVLMEKGESDLNRTLSLRLNALDAKFDSAFVRYHWREMLECVQAVHDHDIVHSDLKPANFLLVSGRLKLIDFGIANAIDTDNTCNVHRESHVGTPNYMSPESITDTNAPQPGMSRDEKGRPLNQKKDMRIGKASDVWSLGCILYQMTYGRPPFAHIPNQISRIMAITNPAHVIEFPSTGVGNSFIPPPLRGLLRRCLNRDPEKRPLIKEMLDDKDAFLNPDGCGDVVLMTEGLLGQIIEKVVERCRDPARGVPESQEVSQYPRSFMGKIREMQAGG